MRAQEPDSLFFTLQAVEVVASEMPSGSNSTDIGQDQLRRNSFGYDVPTLLENTQSVVAINETGIGTGGTSLRIRGTDATRINVSLNGMPMNDPDSHSMYWYDTPDLTGAAGSMQLIRGAGTTSAGTGAFGGAITIATAPLREDRNGDVTLSYGAYNTSRQAFHIGSGLMAGHWIVDARLSRTTSDGYIDRGSSDLRSYMVQAGWLSEGTAVKFITMGGAAKTYLTYYGTTAEDMEDYGRTYHTSGQYKVSDGPFVLNDGTHVDYFDDQTDNYCQSVNQLILDRNLSGGWSLNSMLYFCPGHGYYRQYKDDAWLAGYDNLVGGWEQADLIRRKVMDSRRYGASANIVHEGERGGTVAGVAYMRYTCPHYGTIDWIDGYPQDLYEGVKWYDNDVLKHDADAFVKSTLYIAQGLRLNIQLQYRFVSYFAEGTNDNYDWGQMVMQPIDVDRKWHFLNPGASLDWSFAGGHRIRGSFNIASKEPTRSDFTDRHMFSSLTDEPEAERLYDSELGWSWEGGRLSASANIYNMYYRDQLVPTGVVNDSEDNLNVNVDKSYRRGIELSLEARPCKSMKIGSDCTMSRNRVIGGDDLTYSPSAIGHAFARYSAGGFEAAVHGRYVGSQSISFDGKYSLPDYCVGDIDLSYTFNVSASKVRLALRINNFTGSEYCSYGYGEYLFPQAPSNAIGSMTINF